MSCRVRPHRTALLLVALTLVCSSAAGTAQASQGPPPPPAATAMLPHAGWGSGFCGIVRNQSVSSAADSVFARRGGAVGALLGAGLVAFVQGSCPELVLRAARVARAIFVTARPPSTAANSSLRIYGQVFDDLRTTQIAAQLRIRVDRLKEARVAVCNAFRRAQNTGNVVVRYFAGQAVAQLAAMSAFVRLVIDSCAGFTEAAANYLTSVVLNIAVSNSFRADILPPSALVLRTGQTRLGDGRTRVGADFWSYDSGGAVASCEIDLWYSGAWHSRSGPCSGHNLLLYTGTRYAWAFRARDRAGNWSQWSVTSYGTA